MNLYHVVEGDTYPQAMHKVRERAETPLSAQEFMQACVEDFHTKRDLAGRQRSMEDRLRFFNRNFFTATGVLHKKGGRFMKIIPVAEALCNLTFDYPYVDVDCDYESVGNEYPILDKTKAKYAEPLLADEPLEHPAWRTLQPDLRTLEAYSNIVFAISEFRRNMCFFARKSGRGNSLRPLNINGPKGSAVSGKDCLYFTTSLLAKKLH